MPARVVLLLELLEILGLSIEFLEHLAGDMAIDRHDHQADIVANPSELGVQFVQP
ncbi:hypothetical protein D3C80_1929470 [compost metagenome]